jgi:peptide/nickel transport system substrate-binding protein
MAEAGYPHGLRDDAVVRPRRGQHQRAAHHPGAGEPGADRHQDHDQQGAGRQLARELLKKNMPMIINAFGGWLNYPEYFFFWCYHGQNAVFNTMSYKNPTMDALIDKARFTTGKEYEEAVKGFLDIAFEEVPRVPIFQPLLNVAMQKNVTGYRYWFHRQLDYRQLAKG